MTHKRGDKVEVRNIGSDDWTLATVIGKGRDGTLVVEVDDPEHELAGDDPSKKLRLTVDEDHWREVQKK